jgi:hypothetical protein
MASSTGTSALGADRVRNGSSIWRSRHPGHIGAEKAAPAAPWVALRYQHDRNPVDSGKVTEIGHRRADS